MTDEDMTAAKLKGYNCLVKFKDGEELLLKISELDGSSDDISDWFSDAEKYLNSSDEVEYFPVYNVAVASGVIKYIKKI